MLCSGDSRWRGDDTRKRTQVEMRAARFRYRTEDPHAEFHRCIDKSTSPPQPFVNPVKEKPKPAREMTHEIKHLCQVDT